MAARVWRHLGPGSGGSRERVSLSATDCYIVHEIYSGENAQDQFEYELEQALEVKYKYIVEHTQIGDETAHWITVSNYLHKTAVLAGTACLFTTLALPLDYPHYISLAAGVLSLACCMLYGVSGSLTLAASTRYQPLKVPDPALDCCPFADSHQAGLCKLASAMGNEELWVQPALEMPKRRDILAIVLIVLPWTLLITVWHQSSLAPLLAVHKDEGSDPRREAPPGADPREYCMSDRDIVEVVRTEYVYTRPPPWSDTLPTIHVVTPTYSRPVQKAELTRMANTLLHVPNLHWLVVEDAPRRTPLAARLLHDTGLNYTHLHVETPRNYKLRGDARDPRIPRGTMQRNLALRWLRETFPRNSTQPGVVYFADDDNTYSLELFEEMRNTRRVSVWPVAFVGGLRYEAPRVNGAGKVVGWKTVFDPHRPFAIDMAGFAVNLRLILQRSQAYFKLRGVKGGYQESSLLRELVTLNDLEPKAANCTKILVWHTRTEKPVLVNEGKKGFTDPSVEI
ncbi:Galactosylgalactosylxylosylprotein 3-beta-glucuronosyltransferase 1 [Cricetulus griseus]|uniref:Galactosylgalactosylxylosylprotein 3-beta-glucuronosyltransferase n=2 Tax=Cricetulus griseus TaxID=10029 RepID=G3HW23_CRIGR|nr:Galactosylgalactosylxylosylprotein 3-beta-glucuronosyltransferase 1 [Cricetulus griseus]